MKKKILSIILALVMIVGMVPLGTVTALADEKPDYFSVTNTGTGTATLKWLKSGSAIAPTLQYSTDGGTNFNDVTIGSTEISLAQNETAYFKGDYSSASVSGVSIYLSCTGDGAALTLGGDLTTLLDGEGNVSSLGSYKTYLFSNLFSDLEALTDASELILPSTTLAPYCYCEMFSGCTSLVNTPALPAMALAEGCYQYMFSGCTSLVNAPALPATTLAGWCYLNMFSGCTALVTASTLPATTLANGCYCYMFSGCTSLVNAPALPATALEMLCYSYMFSDCTSLVTAPTLPAMALAEGCYDNMFSGCTSLVNAPALPATTLANGCYIHMFSGCTSLVTAPALSATTLAPVCCDYMFHGCTSLVNAPTLPAMTLAEGCYRSMFSDCTSLVTAPVLPATTLAEWCYNEMFYNCTSLVNAPVLPATTLAPCCYSQMFHSCTSLEIAPVLPATTLAECCYESMFVCCDSLKTAPALPATTLTEMCYSHMFFNCTSLVNAPALPATTLASCCYWFMFSGCTSLVNAPALPAAPLAEWCYQGMFQNCKSLKSITVGFRYFDLASASFDNWLYGVVPANLTAFVPENFDTSYTPGDSTFPEGTKLVKSSEIRVITNDRPQMAAETNHGYLTIDKAKALAGDTVTVTVNPSNGYQLVADSLKATYNDGESKTITPTQDAQDTTKYTFEMPAYAVTVTAEFEEAAAPAHTHTEGEASIDFTTPISDFAGLQTLFSEGGSGYLTEDIDCTAALTVNANVDLCLNDKVLNLNDKGHITVNSGKTFNLYDCGKTEHAGYIDANGLWHLGTGGGTAKPITGGIITSNTSYGGGVFVSGGSFTMNGGSIAGNTASAYGGVYVYVGGNFMMNGGSITGNTAYNGGGVSVYGSFTMSGGSITGNTASGYGGGILNGSGKLYLTAAEGKTITITGNTAGTSGGGVLNWNKMHLSGAVIIKDNVCTKGADYPANLATINDNSGNHPITIDGALTGSEIYVTHADYYEDTHNTGVLTSDFTTNNPGAKLGDFFTYDGSSEYCMILNQSGELEVVKSYAITNSANQTDEATNHGYLTVDKTTAAANDTVTITVTASEGYQLTAGSLKATYNDGSKNVDIIPVETATAGQYTFTMPASDVTIRATFNFGGAGLVSSYDELIANVLTDDEKILVASGGASVDIWLTVEVGEEPEEMLDAVDEKLDDGYQVGKWLNINLNKNVGNSGNVSVTQLKNGTVKIVIDLTDSDLLASAGMTRTYKIVRIHNNIVTILDAVFDPETKTLTFETDCWSNYAIAYKDDAASPCEYTKTVPLAKGTFGMKLGGKDAGEFTFEKNGSGWNIQNSESKYLAMQDGKLILSDTAFAWTYKSGAFSASTKTTQKSSGYWLGFIYIPGSSKTVTTNYYLSTVTAGAKLSTNSVKAELYVEASGDHVWGAWTDCKDGVNHKRVCKNCGETETEAHEYNETTHECVCGAYDPTLADVTISVVTKEKTEKQYVGFFPFGYYKNVKTYTATIKTEAVGVCVTKVQYQLNGSSKWTTGTSVSSDKPINSLKVKVTDSNGKVYDYTYGN